MNFIIRADASQQIGTGHVMRCIALGQMLQDVGENVVFITQTEEQSLLDRLKKENFEVIKIRSDINLQSDAQYLVKISEERKAKWIITDGYKFTTEYQKIIKNNNFKLMCIDDIAECHYVSDIVLNQNLNAENIFKYSCENYTRLLLGIEYVLLRREFRKIKNWERKIKPNPENILITLGGSDPENCTLKILKSIEKINYTNLSIKVLLGAGFKHIEILREYRKSSKLNFEIFQNVENMVEIIKWCDLAISAAGSTVWELIKLRTPIITGIIAQNQVPVAEELSNQNVAENIGWFERLSTNEIEAKFTEILSSKKVSHFFKNSEFFSKKISSFDIAGFLVN